MGTRLAACALSVSLAITPTCVSAQSAPADNPRTVKPERPTVATHAFTVRPGYAELETGGEWDRYRDHSRGLVIPALLKLGITSRTQLGLATGLVKPDGVSTGVGDFALVLKQRVADSLPVLGAVAIIPSVKFPTASAKRGTTTTDASLLLVSSHVFGSLALDINLGYTRRSGDGSHAPKDATLWTVSFGAPLVGPLGMVAEVFGYPQTTGAAGSDATAALLTGPTFQLRDELALDAGAIIRLAGPQPNAWYAGLTYNFGKFWR